MHELIPHYHDQSLPYHQHLHNREVITIIGSAWQLDPVNDFPSVLMEYFKHRIFTTHHTYPVHLDSMLQLVIQHGYTQIINLIVNSKIMLNTELAMIICKHLIKYQPKIFISIGTYHSANQRRLINYAFQVEASGDVIDYLISGTNGDRELIYNNCKIYHRNSSQLHIGTIYHHIDDTVRIVRSNDVALWKKHNITADNIKMYFVDGITQEICEYMDAVGYYEVKLYYCHDMYSIRWLEKHDSIMTTRVCSSHYDNIGTLEVINMFDYSQEVCYRRSDSHPEVYRHFLEWHDIFWLTDLDYTLY